MWRAKKAEKEIEILFLFQTAPNTDMDAEEIEKTREQLNADAKSLMNRVLDYEKVQPLINDKVFAVMLDDFDKAFKVVKECREVERIFADLKKMKSAVKSYKSAEEKLIENHKKLQNEHNHVMSKFRGMYRLSRHDRIELEATSKNILQLQAEVASKEETIAKQQVR